MGVVVKWLRYVENNTKYKTKTPEIFFLEGFPEFEYLRLLTG